MKRFTVPDLDGREVFLAFAAIVVVALISGFIVVVFRPPAPPSAEKGPLQGNIVGTFSDGNQLVCYSVWYHHKTHFIFVIVGPDGKAIAQQN